MKNSEISGVSIAGPPLIQSTLPPNVDDFAMCYYHAHHFLLPSVETSPNYNILVTCMKAHGLATYSVAERCPYTKIEARRYYLSALQMVNTVLRSSASLRDDDILLAVMILGTIETITDNWQKSLAGWSSHLQGCTAILKERGLRQLRTDQGRLLFMQATACLVAQCLLGSNRIPPVIEVLTKKVADYANEQHDELLAPHDKLEKRSSNMRPDSTIWAMHRALLDLTNVNSERNRQGYDAETLAGEVLREDEQLGVAIDQTRVKIDLHTMAKLSLIYEEALSRFVTIQSLNSIRSCRLLLRLQAREVLVNSSETTEPLKQTARKSRIQESTDIIDDLKSQILESVPYQVYLAQKCLARPDVPHGYPSLRQLLSPPAGVSNAVFVAGNQVLTGTLNSHPTIFSADDPPILRISHGYNVLSSLLLVGCISSPGSEDRRLACGLLRMVGEAFSVQQAEIFAKRLEK